MESEALRTMLMQESGLLRIGDCFEDFDKTYPCAEFLYYANELNEQVLERRGIHVAGQLVTANHVLNMDLCAKYRLPSFLRNIPRVVYLLFDEATKDVTLQAYVTSPNDY